MAEYINREAFLQALEETEYDISPAYEPDGFTFNRVYEVVESIPAADVVPVVRCKDCKYLANATVNSNGFLICHVNDMEIAPEDFCSYGECREGKDG